MPARSGFVCLSTGRSGISRGGANNNSSKSVICNARSINWRSGMNKDARRKVRDLEGARLPCTGTSSVNQNGLPLCCMEMLCVCQQSRQEMYFRVKSLSLHLMIVLSTQTRYPLLQIQTIVGIQLRLPCHAMPVPSDSKNSKTPYSAPNPFKPFPGIPNP